MNGNVITHSSSGVRMLLALFLMSMFFVTSCKKEEVRVTTSTTVTGFSPASGPVGTVVVITGTNFSTVLANNAVTFNGTAAAVSAVSAGQITATVPAGATTGKIYVLVSGGGGSATSSSDFTVTP